MGLLKVASTPAATVRPDQTVLDAVKLMDAERVGAVAVVVEGRLVGMFTERDVMRRVVLTEKDPAKTPVGEVMTANPVVARRDMSEREVFRTMVDRHFRHMPIVDDKGAVIGIVALRRLLQLRIENLSERLDSMVSFIGADGPGG